MEQIRAFRREDTPRVLELFRAAFLEAGKSVPANLETYFDRVFFESPWYDEALPSYIHLDRSGTIIGFVGVQPRPMVWRGRRVRAAVATKLMAAPSAGDSLVAVRLLSKVFAGPQDVLLSDLSNDAGRRIWEGLGGSTAPLYSLQWQRPVRPARHSLSWLRVHGVPRLITGGLRPLSAVADAIVARLAAGGLRQSPPGYTAEDLPLEVLVTQLPRLAGDRTLRPEYDERSLQWLLSVVRQNQPDHPLRQRLVRDPRGAVVGWFLYYLDPSGVSDVVHLLAGKGAAAVVFDHLLTDAWEHGAVMLSGRLEPGMVREMSLRHCYFRQTGPWTLAHSRQPELLEAIRSGSAFLSRLEGEW